MGRTFFVRSFLIPFICVLFGGTLAPQARAADSVPLVAAESDSFEDLMLWLDQLCVYVHCTADRGPAGESVNRSDWVVVRFVASYGSYGLRQDLSEDELKLARVATFESLELLLNSPNKLEPEIEKALFLALASLESELID
ncbi:MAG: hypothetical protein JNM86_01255 [Phycisphaerae bacterium]|nr:hypothetical protein [Phycisphaerae bacterium]